MFLLVKVTLDRPYDLLLEDAGALRKIHQKPFKKNESNMLQLHRPAQAILRFPHYLLFIIEALNTILQTNVSFFG